MDSLWTFLKGRALYVSVGHDAFTFNISWLGIALVVGALLLFRYLRR
jgi:LPXTG-motif cell wall-anchored protein